jgi:hypothetical protein
VRDTRALERAFSVLFHIVCFCPGWRSLVGRSGRPPGLVCFHVAVFPLSSFGCTGRLTGVAFMKFVYGAHLDDGLIVLGASVFSF